MSTIEQISKIDRPVLGQDVPMLIFRAFRHFTANYVTQMVGRSAPVVFQNAGRDLGREVGELLRKPTLNEYLGEVIRFTRDVKVGLLKPTEISANKIILGLDECITCAGMDPMGKRICHFEVGFVAGIVETFAAKKVRAFESKCNMMGEGICEVTVDLTDIAQAPA